MKFTSSTLFAALAVAPLSTNAHMILKKPTPLGIATKDPLLESGANFPCKGVPYTAVVRDQWPVGSSQMLETEGTAVHGGGSCQISVTTDKSPTATSKWKVIYSIQGGCPADPQAGGNMAQGDVLPTFNFTIPPEVPNGDFIGGFSWLNKVGNREMYMECFAVTVTGGAKDNTDFDKLPDMAVANIGGPGNPKGCKTDENFDYTFENPGKYVLNAGQGPFQQVCGGKVGNPGGNTSSRPAPAPALQKPSPSQAPAPAVSSKPVPTPPSLVLTSTIRTLITVTAPSVPGPTPANASTGNTNPPPAAAPAPASSQPAAAASGNSSGTGTCSPNGAIICNGPNKFAICNFEKAVWQSVAQGTTCKDGKIAKRETVAGMTTLVRRVR